MTLRDISYLFSLHLRERKIYSYITALCTEYRTSYFTLIPALCQTQEEKMRYSQRIKYFTFFVKAVRYREAFPFCSPMAHTSTGGPYWVSPTSSSGARYHLVATQSVQFSPGPVRQNNIHYGNENCGEILYSVRDNFEDKPGLHLFGCKCIYKGNIFHRFLRHRGKEIPVKRNKVVSFYLPQNLLTYLLHGAEPLLKS